MAEGATTAEPDEAGQVPLGFDAAAGFAQLDQTSPARAGAVRALVDVELRNQPVTELRIHGVSGSNGPTMLEHPTALQVGGDRVAGFYRRWSPDGQGRASVRWKLEAYSWGGLTERPLASASWLLLAPFMMYNLAHFMLPAQRARSGGPAGDPAPRRATGWAAHALLRLLAVGATVQLTVGAATVMVSTVAWQAGAKSMLPIWMGWYAGLPTGWRMAIALAGVVTVVGVLWLISVTTASRYEARTTTVRPEPEVAWPLARPGFWHGQVLVRRQRSLHVAAACSAVALIVALPAGADPGARVAAIVVAAAALAVAVGLLFTPMADWHRLEARENARSASGDDAKNSRPDRADLACRLVLAGAGLAVLLSGLVAGLGDTRLGSRAGSLPGLAGFSLVLLCAQLLLLVVLGAVVAVVAIRNPAPGGRAFRPYLGGGLAELFAILAFCLGSMLTAVVSIGVARILGSPVPGGFRFKNPPANPLAVPWPVYASGAGAFGLVAGLVLATILIVGYYLRLRRQFYRDRVGISITAAYRGRGGGAASDRGRRKLAGVWAAGQLADGIAAPVAVLVGCWLAAIIAAEIIAYHFAGTTTAPHILRESGWLHGTFSLIATLGVVVAAILVIVLRLDYTKVSDRRTIGALWDTATFWPRATHPLAPPCYAERAVPEVVDRIRLITGSTRLGKNDPVWALRAAEQPDLHNLRGLTVAPGPVLLTGYSQGTVIAIAVIAQLPKDVRDKVALLTLACPARRLYGRSFPAYFGYHELTQLSRMLDKSMAAAGADDPAEAGFRWRNVARRSDYIGGWIFTDPIEHLSDADYDHAAWLAARIDQPCWDPVVLVSDADPTPPPVHRHSAWWQDPRSGQVGMLLVDRLTEMALTCLGDHAPGGDASRAARRIRLRRYRGR